MNTTPDPEVIQAGVSALNAFGWVNTIDRLAGGIASQWTAAMTLPYAYALTKLELDNERAAFEKRLHKIRMKNNEK